LLIAVERTIENQADNLAIFRRMSLGVRAK
jgi:hypothetical protein